jgi:hypothetical protein
MESDSFATQNMDDVESGNLKEDIGMFNDPMGYDKNAKSQMEVAREILEDAGLSKEEIEKFISDNMFKKGRLGDRAKEYVNNMVKENESWMKMRAGADGKVFENESDIEEEKSELNETINRFKQIINY